MERPVTFTNKRGQKLFGIVHIPEEASPAGKRIGINLLNPGIKYRVAPNRLNVKLARELCSKGYFVLRFDPEGIGDSEGELPDGMPIADVWGKIQTGLFLSDTITANDFFIDKYGIDELILIGNCGGAITSLLTSREDLRINALCLIDLPIILHSSNLSFVDLASEGGNKTDWYFSEYIKKLFSLNAWYRFITLKTNYGALWNTLIIKFQKGFYSFFPNHARTKDFKNLCNEKKLNILIFESFDNILRENKRVLFILAENDVGTEVFQAYILNGYFKDLPQKERFNELVEVFTIENANHIYTLTEWQELLIGKIMRWLDGCFPER